MGRPGSPLASGNACPRCSDGFLVTSLEIHTSAAADDDNATDWPFLLKSRTWSPRELPTTCPANSLLPAFSSAQKRLGALPGPLSAYRLRLEERNCVWSGAWTRVLGLPSASLGSAAGFRAWSPPGFWPSRGLSAQQNPQHENTA